MNKDISIQTFFTEECPPAVEVHPMFPDAVEITATYGDQADIGLLVPVATARIMIEQLTEAIAALDNTHPPAETAPREIIVGKDIPVISIDIMADNQGYDPDIVNRWSFPFSHYITYGYAFQGTRLLEIDWQIDDRDSATLRNLIFQEESAKRGVPFALSAEAIEEMMDDLLRCGEYWPNQCWSEQCIKEYLTLSFIALARGEPVDDAAKAFYNKHKTHSHSNPKRFPRDEES